MNHQCLVYISDFEYLFPTIVSSIMARKNTQSETDIIIILSEATEIFADLTALLETKGIKLIDGTELLAHSLARLDSSHFQRRISKSAMAKLIVHEVLPANYKQIIYMDGDTQIVSSLSQLELINVPEGKFLAARDYISISELLKTGKSTNRYFNSGVFKFNRDGWIGREALEAFIADPDACGGLHDQGALNYVGETSVILISNRWNFPKQYLHLVKMSSLKIVHYMAHPKPWHGAFFPWTREETLPYLQLQQDHRIFKELYRGISLERKLVYKYRSVKEKIVQSLGEKTSSSYVDALLTGEYLV